MTGKGQVETAEGSAAERVDGRRARSRTSHKRIVAAMMALIEAGDLMPSAARVADEAGVGLRTVFRHFDDMDSLYREISKIIAERIWPTITAPYPGTDWRADLRDLTRRRARVFETMLPFRLAANIKRYQSPYLMGQYGQVVTMERDLVLRLLPAEVSGHLYFTEALSATLSFQNWRAIRQDQAMSVEDASAVVAHMVEALIASGPQA